MVGEQSDAPRTDAAAQFVSHFGWQVHADFARTLERELTTATRERDEARAIANDRDAMVDHRDRALTAMYQRVDVITQERDEARAALAKFLEWLEKDEAGPQYSMPAGREGPDGEAEWRRWWHGQLDLCAQSLELARKALAATEVKP